MNDVRKPGPAPSWFPLRRQLLDSSVWEESPTVRVLWITLLLVASEPGRRGTVDVTLRSLAARACLSPEETRAALDVLMGPDPRSRTKAAEGRRVEALDPSRDWGWRLVNWERYEKDRDAAGSTLRSRRIREIRANATERNGTQRIPSDPTEEKEKENEKEKIEGGKARDARSSSARRRPVPADLIRTWNENRGPLPEARGLGRSRTAPARARLEEVPDLARWAAAVRRIAESPFCRGEVPGKDGGSPWVATLDWLLRPDTLLRIEEGKYDDRRCPSAEATQERQRREAAERRARQAEEDERRSAREIAEAIEMRRKAGLLC